MKKSIIFCVDDEKMVLNSLKTELKSIFADNFIIETAENAKEALDTINELLLADYNIPVVISDYAMPNMKGDEFLALVHANSPETLKILLTGQATVEGVTNSINNAQLYRYIAKPWETNDLILTVNQALKSYENQNLLKIQNEQLRDLSKSLEIKVEERTRALLKTNNLLIEKSKEIELQNIELLKYRNHLEDLVNQRTLELLKAKEKAEESDNLKSAFLANISHEIRTPMNGILGFINLLKDDDTDENEKDKFLTYIENSSQQLLSIITDIVEFSKLETSQVSLKRSTCKLKGIVNNIYIHFIHNVFNKSKIDFKISASDEEITLFTDQVKLQQIIINLINNAVKFTSSGSIELGYTLNNNKEVLFFVKDTGIGIPKEYHGIIFDRFRQIETELSRNNGGTGLGLSISKAYVTLLGGKIWLESEPGKGSTFYFTLPLSEIQTKNNKIPKIGDDDETDLNDITILIAEDDDTNYLLLNYILTKLNINTIRVRNGVDAVATCKSKQNIDLVLMDVKMPLLNGLDACREILKFRKDLPVIAQTAGVFADDRNNAFEAGCADFVTKPINIDDLLEKIRKQIHIYNKKKVLI